MDLLLITCSLIPDGLSVKKILFTFFHISLKNALQYFLKTTLRWASIVVFEMFKSINDVNISAPYKPVGATDHLFPGTWYLTDIDDKHRRKYERKPLNEPVDVHDQLVRGMFVYVEH